MARSRKGWQGWIRREDVDDELLEKFGRYRERVTFHLTRLRSGGNSTADTLGAHAAALRDVPMTTDELAILNRLEPESGRAFRSSDVEDRPARPEFDARAWMAERGIDPDIDVLLHVSKGDAEDADVKVWGTEYRNRVTGEIRFEETHRTKIVRGFA